MRNLIFPSIHPIFSLTYFNPLLSPDLFPVQSDLDDGRNDVGVAKDTHVLGVLKLLMVDGLTGVLLVLPLYTIHNISVYSIIELERFRML